MEIKSCFGLYACFYREVTIYSCRLKVPCKSETLKTISCTDLYSTNTPKIPVLLPVILEDTDIILRSNMLIAFDMEIKLINIHI
jgi:hypothetical protein